MDGLSSSQKARLQEIADGMLKIYHILARMSYLDPAYIHPGPHDISSLLPLYQSLKLSPSIIYLYSILPYIDDDEAGLETFFQGGRFADFRKEEHVEEGRNPLYDDLEDEDEDMKGGMRPWMTPLSLLGNHRSVIIYDAKKHCIGIIDHETCGSTDKNIDLGYFQPARSGSNYHDDSTRDKGESEGFMEVESEDLDKSQSGVTDQDNEEMDDEGGEDEEWEDVDDDDVVAESENDEKGIYDSMASRHAPDVLRDIAKWFEDLAEIPERAGVDSDVNREIYQKNKWPTSDFDVNTLLVDQARAEAAASAKYESEEPIREASKYQGWIKDEDGAVMRSFRDAVKNARGEDELWLAKWELWKAEELNSRMRRKLRDAETKRELEFPDGKYAKEAELIFGEVSGLYEGMWARRRDLMDLQKDMKEKEDNGKSASPALQTKIRQAEKDLKVYEKAYEAARADAERLFPGRSFIFGRGIETLGLDLDARIAGLVPSVEDTQQQLESVREWMSKLPDTAVLARQATEDELLSLQSYLEVYNGQLRGCTAALEKLDGKSAQSPD
ncbi:MAG: hypothetical protein CMN67_15815 [Sphingomonadaceae bacterium]|nr:hypothetical protein [Sphingomonadaceae bacterium]